MHPLNSVQLLAQRIGRSLLTVDQNRPLQVSSRGGTGVFHQQVCPAWAEKPPMVATSALRR
jgi:hypothetical protein